MSRTAIVDCIVKFVSKAVGESLFSAIKSGFSDRQTDLTTRVSFKVRMDIAQGNGRHNTTWNQSITQFNFRFFFSHSMAVQEGSWAHLTSLLMDFHCQILALLSTTANGEAFLIHWSLIASRGKLCISFYERFKAFLIDFQ